MGCAGLDCPVRSGAVTSSPPAVVIVSGVQGTGKTTLARALALEIGLPLFSRDPMMAVLLKGGVPMTPTRAVRSVPEIGYWLQTSLLASQLAVGQGAILECVAMKPFREEWKRIARESGARLLNIETIVSDRDVHRRRVEERREAGRSDVGWGAVEAAPSWYSADPAPDLVADAMKPTADLVAAALSALSQAVSLSPSATD